ncbi:helix-turn-helix domain-containing protein [Nocardia bovistercoris]|nr:helix-turn-helix transcriptional regulator [Nocardia bovistercoris]
MLGLRLQQLRRERGLTQQQVGERIWASGSKISRMESGMGGLDQRDVLGLLKFYGVTDVVEHDKYLALIRLGEQPGWWHRDSDLLPKGFELLSLESAARTIRCYEPAVIPELLQTPEYARATLRLRYPHRSKAEIEQSLAVRLQRQRILHGENPPYLWTLIEESALRKQIGGIAVWREQIDRLRQAIESEHIIVQIVGKQVCGPAIAGGGFVYLRFIERLLPDVVCVSQPTSTLYLEGYTDIRSYLTIADRLAVEAMRPGETAERLRALC